MRTAQDREAWVQPPRLWGLWPPESEYVLGAAAARWASRHHGLIATAERRRETSPPRCDHAFVEPTNAVEEKIVSLDFRNLIRVRPRTAEVIVRPARQYDHQ